MPEFRKKPIVIEAVEYTGKNTCEIEVFMGAEMKCDMMGNDVIRTLEGDMRPTIGDYIIRGVNGELYPCKADIFAKTYDEIRILDQHTIRLSVERLGVETTESITLTGELDPGLLNSVVRGIGSRMGDRLF